MPCGMEARRVRNRRALAILDVTGTPIAPEATGIVDPHDDQVLAGIAAGELDDLGPVAAAEVPSHTHTQEVADGRARRP